METVIDFVIHIGSAGLGTVRDVLPIVAILLGFQIFVVRKMPPNPKRMVVGFGYVILGLTLFLVGLEQALFPIGRLMAAQFTDPTFVGAVPGLSGTKPGPTTK